MGWPSCAPSRTGPRSVAHLDFGALTIAAHAPDDAAGGITPLMRAIAEDLTAARTPALLDEDLVRARWRKLLWNIGFNPLSVILDATTDQLMADPDTVDADPHPDDRGLPGGGGRGSDVP